MRLGGGPCAIEFALIRRHCSLGRRAKFLELSACLNRSRNGSVATPAALRCHRGLSAWASNRSSISHWEGMRHAFWVIGWVIQNHAAEMAFQPSSLIVALWCVLVVRM